MRDLSSNFFARMRSSEISGLACFSVSRLPRSHFIVHFRAELPSELRMRLTLPKSALKYVLVCTLPYSYGRISGSTPVLAGYRGTPVPESGGEEDAIKMGQKRLALGRGQVNVFSISNMSHPVESI